MNYPSNLKSSRWPSVSCYSWGLFCIAFCTNAAYLVGRKNYPTLQAVDLLRLAKVLPVGIEPPSKSAENSLDSSSGAAECAAVDHDLALVIEAWAKLGARSRSLILGIVRKS